MTKHLRGSGSGLTVDRLKRLAMADALRAMDKEEDFDPESPGVLAAESKRERRRARNIQLLKSGS